MTSKALLEGWQIIDQIVNLDTSNKDDVDFLNSHVNHEEWDVRVAILNALAGVEKNWSSYQIIKALEDREQLVVVAALEAMADQASAEYIAHVLPFLKDDRKLVRDAACYVLGCTGSQNTIPVLEKFVDEYSNDEPLCAVVALFQLGQDFRLQEILGFLDSNNYRVRCSVANLNFLYVTHDNKQVVLAAFESALAIEIENAPKFALREAIRKLKLP